MVQTPQIRCAQIHASRRDGDRVIRTRGSFSGVLPERSDMTLTNTVKEHSFLAGFTDSQTAKVFALSEEVSFPENKLILSARERSPYFYLLLSGSVCVEVIGRACVVC